MIMDAYGRVSDAQAITVDAVSTSSVDLRRADRQVGTGEPIGFCISVSVAADFTTANETYVFELITSAAATLTTPTILNERELLTPLLVAGALFFLEVPAGTPVLRYLGMQYDVGGTTPTITVTADLMPRRMFSLLAKAYPKNYTV